MSVTFKMKWRSFCFVFVVVAFAAFAAETSALAGELDEIVPQPGPPAVAPAPALAAPIQLNKEEEEKATKPKLELTPLGYVEVYYAYNFRRPSNGITNFRGFDNRHNSISLSNAAIGTAFDYANTLGGKIVLQVGSTGATYYGAESVRAGAGGANTSDANLWRYLQEAYLTYRVPVGRGLKIVGGLYTSQIGNEAIAVKDHWTWSRSNLFFGLPYYHTGVRAEYEWSDSVSSAFAVFNGWNSVVDNNEEKSVEGQVTYHIADEFSARLLYLGGVERNTGAPEGPWWRHQFDLTVQGKISSRLSAAVQGDYGFEPNRMGRASWWAMAAAARVKIIRGGSDAGLLSFVYRADRFTEHLATTDGGGGGQSSTPIFWNGSEWVTSSTSTLDFRPTDDHLSIRLEHRFDLSDSPIYFKSNVQGDGSSSAPFIPNARYQETLLLGATAWF